MTISLILMGAALLSLDQTQEIEDKGREMYEINGYAEINGTSLYYETAGSGFPFVLIHGGLMDRRMWDGQIEPFSRLYRVIRYDVRGYGRSDKPWRPFSHTVAVKLAAEVPGAKMAVIRDAGHHLNMENPAAFNPLAEFHGR